MQNLGPKDTKLVFTAALKSELPQQWLKDLKIPVAGIGTIKDHIGKAGVVFVITGTGCESSRKTAEWISQNLRPLAVVNIGTAGVLKGNAAQGDIVIPQAVCDKDGRSVRTGQSLPFFSSVDLIRGGRLLSVEKQNFTEKLGSWREFQWIDMEAFWQAEIFGKAAVPFHVVKVISDRCDDNTEKDYQDNLKNVRSRIQDLLSFLGGPGAADISVVIPVCNRREQIAASIDSVLKQTLKPREIIVVDDGSTDGTQDVVKAFEDRVRFITLSKNWGVAYARNTGVEAAAGRWIAFLDSDDIWNKRKLERQWKYLESYPFFEIVQCEEIWIRRGRRVNACQRHKKNEGWIWRDCLDRCAVTPSAVLMRKELFCRFGGFDVSLPVCEDYDLWLRIARDHMIGLESGAGVTKHGGHSDQLSRRYAAMDQFRVAALIKALRQEKDEKRISLLCEAAATKLKILSAGAEKRGLGCDLDRYRQYFSALECFQSEAAQSLQDEGK